MKRNPKGITGQKSILINKFKMFILFLFVMIIFLVSFISFSPFYDNLAQAEEPDPPIVEIKYIENEQDFENFLLDCSIHNLLTRGENPIYSSTTNKKYILTTDIYLRRKNDDNLTQRLWFAQFFNGIFEGRGHSIVNFELDVLKPGIFTEIANIYGYAFFSVIGESGIVQNLNFVAANVDFLEKEAAIVAGTNAGKIENVKVEGFVRGRKWAAGICSVNFGTIDSCLSIVSVNLENYILFFGTSGYICAMNSENAYNDDLENEDPEKKGGCVDKTVYVPSYTLENNVFYDKLGDDATDELGDSIDENGYFYSQNIANNSPPINDNYIWNHQIYDYYGVVWYLEYYKESFELDPYTLIDTVNMMNDINLFNISLDWYNDNESEFYRIILTGDVGSTIFQDTYLRNGHNFYNRDAARLSFFGVPENGTVLIPEPSLSLLGNGIKESPYLISNLADLFKCGEMEEENPYAKKHYLLTNDISLSDYVYLSTPLISNFKGEFDGNNFSISGLMGAVFSIVEEGALVKNLKLSGEISGETGLVAEINYGSISFVDVDVILASELSVGIVSTNVGSISNVTVRTEDNIFGGAAVVSESGENSSIYFTRSMGFYEGEGHSVPFIRSEVLYSSASISFCTNVNNLWNEGLASFTKCAWTELEVPISTEDSIYSLVDNSMLPSNNIYHKKGWKYLGETGFAFSKGITADIPELVFISDNKTYKLNSYFIDKYNGSIIENRYGEKPKFLLTDSIVALMSVSEPDWENLEEINGTEDDDNLQIRLGIDDDYIIGTDSQSTIPKKAVEWLALYGLNLEVVYLASSQDFVWELNGSLHNDDNFSTSGVYAFNFFSDYFDVNGTFVVSSENLSIGVLSYERKDYTFNINSLMHNISTIGLPENIEIKKSIFFRDQNGDLQPIASNFLNQVNNYVFNAEIAGDSNRTNFGKDYQYKIIKGNLSVSKNDIISGIGGLALVDAPVFNGNKIDFLPALSVDNLKPGFEISVKIEKLIKPDLSEVVSPTLFMNAGKYIVKITISAANYNDKTIEIEMFVGRKNVTVDISLAVSEIVFCGVIPNISHEKTGEIYNFPIQGVSYQTAYTVGSAIGTYKVSPAISKNSDNNNYIISLGEDKNLIVNKAELNLSETGFADRTVFYNSLSHKIELDKSLVIFANGDILKATVITTYTYLEESKAVPFIFTTVGSYNLSAKVSAGVNYNEKSLTAVLNIVRTTVKLFADNKTLIFGDSLPDLTFTAVSIDSSLSSGSIISQLIFENLVFDSSCPLYNPVSTVGWPDKLKGDGKYYELPIVLIYVEAQFTNIELVSNSEANGVLKVNKREYSGQLISNRIEYTGSTVRLNFADGLSPGSISWFEVTGGEERLLETAPKNVSIYDDNTRPNISIYRIKANFNENYKYLAKNNVVIDFDIIQATMNISGIYLYTSGLVGSSPIGAFLEMEYAGGIKYLYPKLKEIPESDLMEVIISCNGVDYTDRDVLIKDAGLYQNIEMQISCKQIQNYKKYKSSYLSSIKVVPKTVKLDTLTISDTFKSSILIPMFLVDPSFVVQGDSLSASSFNFSIYSYEAFSYTEDKYVSFELLPQSIYYPGRYVLDVWLNNPNYEIEKEDFEQIRVTYVLNNATVELDLNELPEMAGRVFEETYLNLKKHYISSTMISIDLGDGYSEFPVEFVIDVPTPVVYVNPGVYNIIGANDILHMLNEGLFISCVRFSIAPGSGIHKLIVKKREVYFDWTSIMPDTLIYKAEPFIYASKVAYTKGSSSIVKISPEEGENLNYIEQSPANITKISIIEEHSKLMQHSGTYKLIATCDMPDKFSLMGSPIWNVIISPVEIFFDLDPIPLFAGERLPGIEDFSINFSAESECYAVFQKEKEYINISLNSDYDPLIDVEGMFDLHIEVSILNGGDDYIFLPLEGQNMKILVNRRDFTDIQLEFSRYVYTGEVLKIQLIGEIPEGASIQYSDLPINVGTYPISVTLEKKYYNKKIIQSDIEIVPAKPSIESLLPTTKVLYRVGFSFSESLINARAVFKNTEIEGQFRFVGNTVLKYGLNSYDIEFVPTDFNFSTVNGFFRLDAYIEPGDVRLIAPSGGEGDSNNVVEDIVETSRESYTISLDSIENLTDAVFLYVNGVYIFGGQYTFYEDSEDVLIEIRTENGTIYTQSINVFFGNDNDIAEELPTNTDPSLPINGDNLITHLSTGAIIGISFGSLVFVLGIVFGVIFLIKRKIKL